MYLAKKLAVLLCAFDAGSGLFMLAARADTVTDWNVTAIDVMKAAGVTANPWSRTLAMVHVAMSDAINSVQPRYARYLTSVPSVPTANASVAAASAARQILLQLYPTQKPIIEKAYATSLEGIADSAAKIDGIALGERVALAVQADRAADGTSVPDTYRPITAAGTWVPTHARVRAVCACKAMGHEKCRAVQAGTAAKIVERALCPRLQRDKDHGCIEEHRANARTVGRG